MALIECGECKKEVSIKANSCPHCGAPLVSVCGAIMVGDKLTARLATRKKLQLQSLIAGSLCVIGFGWMFAVYSAGESIDMPDANIGVGLAVFGTVWYLVTRVRIWWHHK